MKIRTITCHNVYNYGASLQAFALQHYLEQKGHKVEIINFRPWYNRGGYDLFSLPHVSKSYRMTQWCPLLRWIVAPIRNRHLFRTYGRKAAFDRFANNYLHTTNMLYGDSEQLKATPPEADLYIAGSDQIWNTDMQNGTEPAFYLDFGDDVIRRISYAASFGIDHINPQAEIWVKELLSRFDAISVREQTGLDILTHLGIDKAVQVLDPVFLLSADEWKEVAGKGAKTYKYLSDQYILVYDFIDDARIGKFARDCASKKGLPIVAINDMRRCSYAQYNITDAGPLEFVQLIDHATMVITNSFHATAFSCIFDKDFYTFPLSTQHNSSRMTDLLREMDVMERYIPTGMTEKRRDALKLEQGIAMSKDYLNRNLQKCNEENIHHLDKTT